MAEILRGPFNIVVPLPGESSVAKSARDARDVALAAAASTDADVIATAADRVQTGLDRAATAADRVQTGADAAATAADRIQTGLDRVQTGSDRAAAAGSASTATTQAGIATTQAGIATTQAGLAAGSASAAAATRTAVEAAVTAASIGQPVIPLLGTADFHAGLTFARASTGTLQTPFAAPTTLTEFASGAPRWDAQFGLRLEAAMAALDTNPRFEGAVAGIPGTLPSGLSVVNNGGSILRRIVGTGTENGYPYIEVEHTLTGTTNNATLVDYGSASGVAGLAYSGAMAVRLTAGTPVALSVTVNDGSINGTATNFTPTGSYQFLTPAPLVATGASPVIRTRIRNATGSATATFTVRYIFFNLVQDTIRSSQIYPPVGTPGPVTRARDTLSGALSGLSLTTPGLTIVGRAMIPFTPASGLTATILQLDGNGSDADAIRIATAAGSNSIVGTGATTAGGAVSTPSLGSLTPGAEFAWGLSVNLLTGGGIFNLAGGTSQVLPDGSLPLRSLITHLRYGGQIAAGAGLNGFARRSVGRPFIVSATDLAALVAAA